MVRKIYLAITILIVLSAMAATAGGIYYFTHKPVEHTACTLEAKLCPDGSAVGRVGPNCEFAPCPTATNNNTTAIATIKGSVSIGPICPVERLDSPCPVPPAAYTSREIILYAANGTTEVKRMYFASDGTYRFEVPAGTYVLKTPNQGIGGSKDLPKNITVRSGETIEFNFSIDTGIR